MKTINILVLTVALIFAGCAAQNPVTPVVPVNPDFTINVTFNYDYTNFAACSGTLTKGCISGFTWGYLQGTTQVQLKTSANTACTGTTQPEACSDSTNSQLPMGSLTFYVIANYIDNSGNTGSTSAATTPTPTTVTAGAPTNAAVSIH